jgi:hypothetical protein
MDYKPRIELDAQNPVPKTNGPVRKKWGIAGNSFIIVGGKRGCCLNKGSKFNRANKEFIVCFILNSFSGRENSPLVLHPKVTQDHVMSTQD